jgi:hypothetical protein
MVWIIRWFRPPPHVGGYTVPLNFTPRLAATGMCVLLDQLKILPRLPNCSCNASFGTLRSVPSALLTIPGVFARLLSELDSVNAMIIRIYGIAGNRKHGRQPL